MRKGKRELRLSNLDKVFWPEEGITKGDLIDYYREVAPVLVPHLKNRPFTMRALSRRRRPARRSSRRTRRRTCPTGSRPSARSSRPASRRATKKWVEFPLVNDELALLWMVNMGCIDMNTWYSRIDRPDRPDFVLFDLDPTPEVPWSQTIEVALLVKELLDGLGLESFPKTSGGKGFHVLVPLDRRSTYEDSRAFAELVAGAIARAHPELATTAVVEGAPPRRADRREPERRGQDDRIRLLGAAASGRAGLDAARAGTRSCPSSTRRAFTMPAVLARVASAATCTRAVLTTRQSLSKALAAFSG